MKAFKEKYGPWALVTGASSGIGAEFAKKLAETKLNIVLVARQQERLEALAKEITARYAVETKIIVADLTADEGINSVKDGTETLEIGLLVNNAGVEDSGYFLETPVEKAIATLELNCKTPLVLTHHFAKKMADRKRGGIIFMSSIVAFQGVPYIANYSATKAYDLILSESLSAEFQKYHIEVLSINPGFADTKLSPDFDFKGLPIKLIPPAQIAADGIKALGKKRVVIVGLINKFLYFTGKYLQPRKLNSFAFSKVFAHVLRKKLGKRKSR